MRLLGKSALGIAVDKDGNAYITGGSGSSLYGETNIGQDDIFIIKYNSAGIRQWAKEIGTA